MKDSLGGFGVLLIIAVVWLSITAYDQKQTIKQMTQIIENCSDTIDQANSNIHDLNSQIDDAQDAAWSDYDTMGSTLEDLQDGDEVDGSSCVVPSK